jgi:hypothetical protein
MSNASDAPPPAFNAALSPLAQSSSVVEIADSPESSEVPVHEISDDVDDPGFVPEPPPELQED